ncbi:TIGR04063 family PEP-CTERM/XrtA system glycosyltransferase [Parapedomonas caeni]|jgi:PEP-CTERM/exosortase A-associated glycosyltransferase
MRILHVLDHSLPLHSGYTFRSRSILREQNRRGWETVHLTTPRHYHPGPDPEEADGLRFHRTPRPDGLASRVPVLRELAEVAATTRRLEALVAETRPDILHAHSPVLNAMAVGRVARRTGLPWVYEIRAFWEDASAAHGTSREGDLRYTATHWLETRAAMAADAVGCICAGLMGDLRGRGIHEDKLFLTPNAVDQDQFTPGKPRDAALAAELGLTDAEIIGFIGSFYDYEGLDVLVAAMPLLLASRPRLHLLLVGGGPVEAALKAQVAALGVGARVHFTGRVPHAEVDRYYSLIDVLVYPRKRMRLTELVTPLKPLEAMAEGKLVAASDVGGHRELILAGETGELFRPDDPAALAESVSGLLDRPEMWEQRRETARRYVATERTWAMTVDHYVPVYARLLGGARRG